LIKYEDILDARDNLNPEIIRTPLQIWRHASSQTGKNVNLKVETLQRTGSFKPRGAWNRLRLVPEKDRARGVICASAGNHAQGVAFAAHCLGVKATIVMPETAPEIKIAQTKLYGDPEIIIYGENLADSNKKAFEIQKERGSIFIHAYDDDDVIAGQGTIGLEIIEQCPEVDTIVVPVGGGGLLSGIAVSVRKAKPDVKFVGVQAKGAAAVVQALETGKPVTLTESKTIADGINVRSTGIRPIEIMTALHLPVMKVTDDQIRAAMIALCQTAKLVVEPAGAAGAAAVLFYPELFKDSENIVVVLSGANINICCYAAILQAFPPEATADAGLACLSCTGGEKRQSCLGSARFLIGDPFSDIKK
jgi:threonine dehydratase